MVESPVRRSAAAMRRSGEFPKAPRQYSRRSLYDDVLARGTRTSSRRQHTSAVTVQHPLIPSARCESKTRPKRARVLDNPVKPCGSAAAQGRSAVTLRSHLRRRDRPRQPRPAVHAAAGSQIELMQTLRPQLTPETATKSAQCGQHGWIHDRASHPPCHSTDLFHH